MFDIPQVFILAAENGYDTKSRLDAISNTTEEEKRHYAETKQAFVYSVGFLCFVLFVGVLLREKLRALHFPFTALLFIFGIILGIFSYNFQDISRFTKLAKVDSRLIMHLFLPAIIYESAFSMEPHMFAMALTQCLLLAIPGVIFCTILTAVFAKTVLGLYGWNWIMCFIFGTILSATDPVAVVALLKECGISPSLTTLIEGESLLNDGAAIVLFEVLLDMAEGKATAGSVVQKFFFLCFGAIAVGYLISLGTIALLRRTENDTDVEVTFILTVAYITYFTSEVALHVSGVLAVVVLGVTVGAYKSNISYEEEETTVHQFWKSLSFWANTLIFTIVGIIIPTSAAESFATSDIGLIIATYFAVSVFRGLMIFLLSPLLQSRGYGFSWNYGIVLTWGGLRGAVGLALVMIMQSYVHREVGDKILIQVSGIIVFTLVINAPTMRLLLKLLGFGKVSGQEVDSMQNAVELLRDVAGAAEKACRMDRYLKGMDRKWVHDITLLENPYDSKAGSRKHLMMESFIAICSECNTEFIVDPREKMKETQSETRLQILRTMENLVSNQHSRYGILRRTLRHLLTAIENAADSTNKLILAEDIQKKHLNIPHTARVWRPRLKRLIAKFDIEHRQSKALLNLAMAQQESEGFKKFCLGIYLSPKYAPLLYWTLLINVFPVVGEIMTVIWHREHHLSEFAFEKEMVVFEVFHGVLALFYVFDAVITIGALGCRRYFRCHGNKLDFFITLIAVVQGIVVAVLLIKYPNMHSRQSTNALVALGAVRVIRLFRMTLAAVLMNLLDQVSAVFYEAFDLAIGFLAISRKAVKGASKIVEWEESAKEVQFASENNVLQMLTYIDSLDEECPDVTFAWRTHRAAVYILRDMKRVIEEMVELFIIDETDAELLHSEIAVKLTDTLCAPRFMEVEIGPRHSLESVPWITSDELIELILDTATYSTMAVRDVAQYSGEKHKDLRILSKGVLQISGRNDGEKTAALPNADSFWYFAAYGEFLANTISPKAIGMLGYLLGTPSVTTALCSTNCEFIHIDHATLKQAEVKFDDFLFHVWRSIALEIALTVLSSEENYEDWPDDKLKIHLEEGIMPDLTIATEMEVQHPIVTGIVLIQGRARDSETDGVYVGPTYIPSSVNRLVFDDNPSTRPLIVMILLREEKLHSRAILRWESLDQITYKGLCLVHKIRRASITQEQQLEMDARRQSFKRRFSYFFKSNENQATSEQQLRDQDELDEDKPRLIA